MKRVDSGYAYVEVLIAALVVTIALAPAAESFRDVASLSVMQRTLLADRYQAMATMESVLAEPFSNLQAEADATSGLTPSSFSDPIGTENRRLVMVAPYDLDNADADDDTSTGVDDGVVLVSVSMDSLGTVFQSIVTDSV